MNIHIRLLEDVKNVTLSTLVVIGLSMLAGCGGGDSSVSSGVPATAQGFFIDDPVEGLEFVSGGEVGVTDENGAFTYEVGMPITFSVGGVELGTVDGEDMITPFKFGDKEGRNIASFLQSIDTTPGDFGIKLPEKDLSVLLTQPIEFGVDDPVFAGNASVADILNDLGRAFVPQVDAVSNANNVIPVADISGNWVLIREYSGGTCNYSIGQTWHDQRDITMSGNAMSVIDLSENISFEGTIIGHELEWSGTRPGLNGIGTTDFGTTNTVSADGNSFEGNLSIVHTNPNPANNCIGDFMFMGTKDIGATFTEQMLSDSWAYQKASSPTSTPHLFRYYDDHTGWRRYYDSGILLTSLFTWSVNTEGDLILEYPNGSVVGNEIIGQQDNRDDILFTCTGPCTTVQTNQFVKSKYLPKAMSADNFINTTYTITSGTDVYTVVFDDYAQTNSSGQSYGFATSSLNGAAAVDLSWAISSNGALSLSHHGSPGAILNRDILFPIIGLVEDGMYTHFGYSVNDGAGDNNGVGTASDPFFEASFVNEVSLECVSGCV